MLDRLLETLRAWHSDEAGRHFSLVGMASCAEGMRVMLRLMRGRDGAEQTDQSIPLNAPADEDWPEAVRERVLRLIVELQQEAEA